MSWRGQLITLGARQYWLEGDDAARSVDSRFFGPVDDEILLGRAWVVYRSGENKDG
ncbi:MAG: S26 family signal peptidase [Gemmatimonadaceae bacterium]|nr:S26 family signal peptidase [Gloeobacterales cyanobacterium ES-bin-141]